MSELTAKGKEYIDDMIKEMAGKQNAERREASEAKGKETLNRVGHENKEVNRREVVT